MKTLLPFLLIPLLGWFSALPSLAQEGIDQDLTQKISTFLTECEKIKPGMTRADLLKVFTTEGGLSTPAQRTYVYRPCRCLKIDVKFSLSSAGPNGMEEKPTDTIVKISPPYVQWMVLD